MIRNVTKDDIPRIIDLQKASFSDMAAYGMVWPSYSLYKHICIFPEGQLYAEVNGRLVGSSSSLIVSLKTEYADHTWNEITALGSFSNHTPNGDSLYGADISVHPDFRNKGIAAMLYNSRKDLAIKLNLRRIIAGGRLYDYHKFAKTMSADEYAKNVVAGVLNDTVLSFQLKNGFRFIKILPNYLYDKRSLNYASFVEWINPQYRNL